MWFLVITFFVHFPPSLFSFLHFFCINVLSFSSACLQFVSCLYVVFALNVIIITYAVLYV
jgi:hypothetical protein